MEERIAELEQRVVNLETLCRGLSDMITKARISADGSINGCHNTEAKLTNTTDNLTESSQIQRADIDYIAMETGVELL